MAQKTLNFSMQQQSETNWCWAASSTSVSEYYKPASTWTQCKVADTALGQTSCCQNGSSASCNIPWYLGKALGIVGHDGGYDPKPEPLTTVRTEVDADRPLGFRVAWNQGGAHFGILVGYDTVAQTVEVRDPWWGNSTLPYNVFRSNYQGMGSWQQSYFTKK